MSYIYYPTAPPARAPRFPWAVFLILSVAFFFDGPLAAHGSENVRRLQPIAG